MRVVITLLIAVIIQQALEVHCVRQDEAQMRYAYGTFLARKVGGKPLSDAVNVNSLAVFKTNNGMLACSLMR